MRATIAALTVWCVLIAGRAVGDEADPAFELVDLSRPVRRTSRFPRGQDRPAAQAPARAKARPPACLAREPDAAKLIRQAWRAAGLRPEADAARMGRLAWSAWLPKLGAGVAMDLGDRWDYRYEPGSPRVDQLHQDDGWRWDVDLSWDLSRLAFQKEELQLAREAERRATLRRNLAVEVARLYWRRRSLLLAGWPAADSRNLAQIQEMTAVLDAWTGGRFANLWCGRRSR